MINYDHIILISLDTLRADCIGASPKAYNFSEKYDIKNFKLKTESLDEIIKKGVYYNNCFTIAGYTGASHAAYFTGFWPKNNGVFEFFNRSLQKNTVFEYGQMNGYKTIFQTDFPVILGKYIGFDRGVDDYYIESESAAFEKLKCYQKDGEKTLSFFHFGGIHYPYGFHTYKYGKESYVKKIEELEIKYKLDPDSESYDKHDESYRDLFDKKLLKRYKKIVKFMYDQGLYNELFALYLEGINFFFANRFNPFLEGIVNFVDNTNSLLVVFADHGEGWNENCYGHHNSLENDILNVPLVFYGKNITPAIHNDLVRTIDFTPTIMKFIDNTHTTEFDGKPLDIFNEGEVSEEGRIGIAQYRMNKDINEYHSFHEKVLNDGKIKESLSSTYLAAETIFDDKYKIFKTYNKEGILNKEFYIEMGREKENIVDRNNILNADFLNNILKTYNDTNIFKWKNNTISSDQFKEYFNDLGYNI